MKLLTVKQPWAQLLVSGVKKIETRTWATRYRGTLGVHAGKKADPYGPWTQFPNGVILPHSAVVGRINLIDCRPMTPADEPLALCEWREGLFAWVCAEATAFREPIPMKGRLGLWDAELP